MGGSAFHALLGKEAFPRVPPGLYSTFKARLLPKVCELYSFVAIPVEAPEKADYGDLDFLVAGPKPCIETGVERVAIPHGMVQTVLGAKHVIPMDGNRTSNYAVPISGDECKTFLNLVEDDPCRTSNSEVFFQVDVHVCKDATELERIRFFNSYGDMGMMLGLITRSFGLRLGAHGLKLPIPNHAPFLLSDSFDKILPFLGLSRESFDSGFQTKKEVFRWVASMKYFNPRFFRSTGPGAKRVKPERKMYGEFVTWIEQEYLKPSAEDHRFQVSIEDHPDIDVIPERVKLEALEFFDKTSELQALIETSQKRQRLRSGFSGHQVRDWTDMGNYWTGVKKIMDAMREQMGGDEGVLRFLEDKGEEELCAVAIRVRDELGLIAASSPDPGRQIMTDIP